jgi:hypothetical protein
MVQVRPGEIIISPRRSVCQVAPYSEMVRRCFVLRAYAEQMAEPKEATFYLDAAMTHR